LNQQLPLKDLRQNIKESYQSKLEQFTVGYENANKKIRNISMLRVSTFLVGVILIYLASSYSALHVIIVAAVFFPAFIGSVMWHVRAHKQKDELQRLQTINRNELEALDGKYSQFDSGEEFPDEDHHFAGDLDIFGTGSIFQYLNRSSTIIGKTLLASWFLNPEKDVEIIKARQKAVTDLNSRVDWRQKFQSVGMWMSESSDDKQGILDWLKKPIDFKKGIFTFLIYSMPFISTFMLVMLFTGYVNFQLFTIYMLIPLGIAFSQVRKIGIKHELVSRKSELLHKYSKLIGLIESEHFNSSTLIAHQNSLKTEHHASTAIQKLSKIVNALDARLNIFGWLFLNYFILWDILQARRLEQWRENNRDHVPVWFDVLSEIDALNSLGCFAYNHPGFILPEPVENTFKLEAKDCGHPLINPQVRVDNPVNFYGWDQFVIITGANMAGKSTYLRTVAVNFILAMIGAPVCAREFRFSPASVFTSIRTKDNLLQNESYFFAELKRLKAIIDELEKGHRLFIVLDEILKGTNSKDKQSGSKALLKQLIRYGSSGLIATHDLALGDLINEYPDNIRNMRFEVEIVDDELIFDYKLKDGISRNLNATFLMKKMGITI
jgi:DNA mismatch repair ATPase MutS